jgi:hypothetical protein
MVAGGVAPTWVSCSARPQEPGGAVVYAARVDICAQGLPERVLFIYCSLIGSDTGYAGSAVLRHPHPLVPAPVGRERTGRRRRRVAGNRCRWKVFENHG